MATEERAGLKGALAAGKEVRQGIRKERQPRPETGTISRASEAPSGRPKQVGQKVIQALQHRGDVRALKEEQGKEYGTDKPQEPEYPQGSRGWQLGQLQVKFPNLFN